MYQNNKVDGYMLEDSKVYLHYLTEYIRKLYPNLISNDNFSWRVLFDQQSSEFGNSSIDDKKSLIKALDGLGCLDELIYNYKFYYEGIGRKDIAEAAALTLEFIRGSVVE